MDPSKEPENRMTEFPRGFGKKETGYWDTPFEYCKATCRTTSRSTQHENAFIGDRRYCYTPGARPRLPVPPAPPVNKDLTALVGKAGDSCDVTCRKRSLECNEAHFAGINDCNTLRSYFMCEAGCGQSNYTHSQFPGYIIESAPKNQWPAMCFSYFDSKKAAAGLAMHFNCSASLEHVQRLCPCEPAPGLGSEAAQVDALLEEKGSASNEEGLESKGEDKSRDSVGVDGGIGAGPSDAGVEAAASNLESSEAGTAGDARE